MKGFSRLYDAPFLAKRIQVECMTAMSFWNTIETALPRRKT